MTRHTSYTVQVRRADGHAGATLTYCYGSPLRVGDRVVCPATPYSEAFIAEVVALGSDYSGHVKPLLCRVAPDRKRP
jgi:hypothetical protein